MNANAAEGRQNVGKNEKGMNEILTALFARKSMRAYTKEPVSPEQKELILKAACATPTAGNQQLYTILDITDQRIKDKLAVSCDDQPFIAEAAMVLLFCADCQKWYDAFVAGGCEPRLPGVGDLMLAVTDCAIAAQNAVTAADSLGLGSCYIGDIMEQCEFHRELPAATVGASKIAFQRFAYQSVSAGDACTGDRVVLRRGDA